MKTFVIAIVSFIAGAVLAQVFLNHYKKTAPPPAAIREEAPAAETNEEGVVKLTLDKQTLIGLLLASPDAAALAPLVTGFGRVIDPAGLIASVSESELAQAALAASQKEFDRLNVLHQQNQNVSTRVLETAEAALKRDQLANEAARLKILNIWGRAILDHPGLDNFVRSLAEQTNALVRVDLALTDRIDFTPKEALLTGIIGEKPPVRAAFISKLSSVDPQSQGQAFLFLIKQKPGEWPIGTVLSAHLEQEGAPARGFIVPRSSVVRSQGAAWIYVQKDSGSFMRRPIETDWPTAKGWFVTNGLAATNKIIVQAAQTVLSQELSGAAGAVGARD